MNVQGLTSANWKVVSGLLGRTYDFLFIGETWYIDHARRSRERCVVASSTPDPEYRRTRPKGGLYLLATDAAKARISSQRPATEHAITFSVDKYTITGLYLPPSLSRLEVDQVLLSVSDSTVILGDLNVRFRGCLFQDGQPGPPERLATITGFISDRQLIRLVPDSQYKRFDGKDLAHLLTVDHCFIYRTLDVPPLRLLLNRQLGITTDHRYMLHLTLASLGNPALHLIRFRNRRLNSPKVASRLARHFEELYASSSTHLPTDDIDGLNAYLVKLCQTSAGDVLGSAPSTPPVHAPKIKRSTTKQYPKDQSSATSIRLYKRALRNSAENGVLLPSEDAQARGIEAVKEVFNTLRARYHEPAPERLRLVGPSDLLLEPFTKEQIAKEIVDQDALKACGADGVHIKLLKALAETSFLDLLYDLYTLCLEKGKTPQVWNRTDVYLLLKDPEKAKTATNIRPITLICMFRKIFERLLLTRFPSDGWARLHPGQAGFRSHYATCMNAAVVHHLLSSRLRSTAIFLDFRSAFDVVSHSKLSAILEQRGCPALMRSLINSLMFTGVRSRVLANGQASKWFLRTRGVLQGSPLSPILFNIFLDSLLVEVNGDYPRIPICLFYADDGCLVLHSSIDAQKVLDQVYEWSQRNGIELNVRKCGWVSSLINRPQLRLGLEEVPFMESYDYLGFPMTASGIDFRLHLLRRTTAAVNRSNWLGLYSDDWGPAHRLRIYKQYLAPMFEYGAPLVVAWMAGNSTRKSMFLTATNDTITSLMGWVTNSKSRGGRLTTNLCGLTSLQVRFEHIHLAYGRVLSDIRPFNPLRLVLESLKIRNRLNSFAWGLRPSPEWLELKREVGAGEIGEKAWKVKIRDLLKKLRMEVVEKEGRRMGLTRLIPIWSRQKKGLFLADISLAAPMPIQEHLFQYRQAKFRLKSRCVCDPIVEFHRGHETCQALPQLVRLTSTEKAAKTRMKQRLSLGDVDKFTDIDFLLNSGRILDASKVLQIVDKCLGDIYHQRQLAEATTTADSLASTGPG